MAEGTAAHRAFADRKHASGQWSTRSASAAFGPARAVASYCSYKRYGVALLAKTTPPEYGPIVDIGAGQGAYAHWFSSVNGATVIAVDISFEALRRHLPPRRGAIHRVCADAHRLPLKSQCAAALYSVDTLGHVADQTIVLDEMLRVARPGTRFFLHSECADYKARWPDRMLEKKLGFDMLARREGHISLLPVAALRSLVARRFLIERVWSPAGITGWLTGYPEKYQPAFNAARCRTLAFLTGIFAIVKIMPIAGFLLRFLNSTLNRLEIALGIEGGGSVFMLLRKPPAGDPAKGRIA